MHIKWFEKKKIQKSLYSAEQSRTLPNHSGKQSKRIFLQIKKIVYDMYIVYLICL